jgi:excisionase family DNA binding protein
MTNPFDLLDARLRNIEKMLEEITSPTQVTEEMLYSVKSLAKEIRVSELTIRNWIKEGKIKAKRIGGRIFIEQSQFENGLKEVKSLKYKR